MTINLILFMILALVAIATALGMLFSSNAVYSALFLVLNFATVAVFYIMLGAPFIAMSQVTVYAGAIMVLFLFVIMLLGAERLPPSKTLPWQKPLAITLAVILAAEATLLMLPNTQLQVGVTLPNDSVNTLDNLQRMGNELFGAYLLPFEVTSILLLVAMVGAIVLTKQEKKGQKQ